MENKYSGERFLPDECKGEMTIEHFQRYQFAKQFVEGKIVLDAACGEGYGSSFLAQNGARVTGMDIDADAVECANKKYANEKLSYIVGSIEKLPFEDHSIDVIVSFETIEHVEATLQDKFLKEIVRVLKSDGMLIMSTPNKRVYTDLVKGENEFHIKEFYVPEYKEFLKNVFEHVEFLCQYPDTGYFITRVGEVPTVVGRIVEPEDSRYIISICSNAEINLKYDTAKYAQFDDSMYYFLNMRAHELEKTLIEMKMENDAFVAHLENDINELKTYINELENKGLRGMLLRKWRSLKKRR